jgi:hypothetical protein
MTSGKSGDAKTAASRAFLRSLNILLKFTRLYGFDHVRTAAQCRTAWNELQSAIANDASGGLLLGVSGAKLLLDGVPIEAAPAERSFAELLSQAGLASISFTSQVTQGEFAELVKAFALAGTKAAEIAGRLKTALGEAAHSGIKVNEVRFVAEDSANPRHGAASEVVAQSLAGSAGQMREWMNDPQKLLEMIVAAEGERSGGRAGPGTGTGGGGGMGGGSGTGYGAGTGAGYGPGAGGGSGVGGSGSGGGTGVGPGPGIGGGGSGYGAGGFGGTGAAGGGSGTTGAGLVMEDDVINVVRLLAGIHQASQHPAGNVDSSALQKQFYGLPLSAQELLRQALASLPRTGKAEGAALLRLAEHMAIHVALKRYERGEVKVNAVRQMLDRMGGEIENLRKILTAHEEKMSKSGLMVESHAEILDRQFWAVVPDTGKRAVLTSPEAYCIPPKNVRQYVTKLMEQNQAGDAVSILMNYANCVQSRDPQTRRRAAIGLSELAELYSKVALELLNSSIRMLGNEVAAEHDPELQKLLSAAFVRLSQEATSRKNYEGMLKALESIDRVERGQPALADSLRPRLGIENHMPELIEEALRLPQVPAGLVEVLRRVPRAAAEQVTGRFNRCERREECQRLAKVVQDVGAEGVAHLRGILQERPAAEATGTVGMLSLLDPGEVEVVLLDRLGGWDRAFHDATVRQLASAGAPGRARLLVALLGKLDPLVWSEAVDEIGMSGDASAAPALLPFAEGQKPDAAASYLRVKAIEALGRLRATAAAPLLHKLVEEKKFFRWAHPHELRVVAAQALQQINPAWATEFLPKSGLSADDLRLGPLDPNPEAAWLRHRRYARVPLPRALEAVAETAHGEYKLATQLLSLGGGLAATESRMTAGVQASMRIQSGLRPLRSRVLVRRAGPQQVGFEFVEMDLEERGRLRKMLAAMGKATSLFSLTPTKPDPQAA